MKKIAGTWYYTPRQDYFIMTYDCNRYEKWHDLIKWRETYYQVHYQATVVSLIYNVTIGNNIYFKTNILVGW